MNESCVWLKCVPVSPPLHVWTRTGALKRKTIRNKKQFYQILEISKISIIARKYFEKEKMHFSLCIQYKYIKILKFLEHKKFTLYYFTYSGTL